MKYIKNTDKDFPPLLKEIHDCPEGIYVRGNIELLSDSFLKIAIVGTRRATSLGRITTQKIAEQLARRGISIISGLAFGIDKEAHRGCLDGGGRTIAVLAVGLDMVYPEQHRGLAKEIIDNGGALVSEYSPGTPALPHQFLERNRIVSGLAGGVLVIEAPKKSGALSTAAHALDQNRDVFVVPGSINNPNYIGSHQLIKQGAALATSADDILEAYNMETKVGTNQLTLPNLTSEQKKILIILNKTGSDISIDKICQITKLQPQVVNKIITSLIIDGIIREESGKYFII